MIPSLWVCVVGTETDSVTSWLLQSLMTDTTVTASGFDEVTEFGYLSSRCVGLVPSDENRLLVHDYVVDGPAALYDYVMQCASHGLDKEHVKCTVMNFASQTQPGRQSC
jgi:hypothetical protein